MTGFNTAYYCGINYLHADNMANILNYYAEILNRLDLAVKILSDVG